jgi:hypothetical protein
MGILRLIWHIRKVNRLLHSIPPDSPSLQEQEDMLSKRLLKLADLLKKDTSNARNIFMASLALQIFAAKDSRLDVKVEGLDGFIREMEACAKHTTETAKSAGLYKRAAEKTFLDKLGNYVEEYSKCYNKIIDKPVREYLNIYIGKRDIEQSFARFVKNDNVCAEKLVIDGDRVSFMILLKKQEPGFEPPPL